MAKSNSGKLISSGLSDNDDSNNDSDHELNNSAHSGYLGGVIIFCDLPVCSGDHCIVCGKSTAYHGDNQDGSAHHHVSNTRGPGAMTAIATVRSRAVRALRSRGAKTPPNRPRSETASPNPSERRGGVFLEKEPIKNGADAPHEQQRRRF